MIRLLAAAMLVLFAAAPASSGWLKRGYEPWEEVHPTDRVDWIDAAPQIASPKTPSYLGDDAVIAVLAERGFWGIAPRDVPGPLFFASATDNRGNRLHLSVDRRTGEVRRNAELGRREIWKPIRHAPY